MDLIKIANWLEYSSWDKVDLNTLSQKEREYVEFKRATNWRRYVPIFLIFMVLIIPLIAVFGIIKELSRFPNDY